MLISLNWLKQYVDIPEDLDPKELGDKFTLSTMEIEEIRKQAEMLDKVVVGKVLKTEKHPNADKLKVAKVDVGKEYLQIVCGGTNLKDNMLVAVALVGAKVKWHGQGELVALAQTKIRGVESFGMICASEEIGLGGLFPAKEGDILDLTDLNFNIGQNLKEALNLNDVIFEVDNKTLTNRPDLWGHYGIAREAAALLDLKLKPYLIPSLEEVKEAAKSKLVNLKVEVENSVLCPRYLSVVVDEVSVTPSPDWLKNQLEILGLKSINSIVDITNYVMFDLGQPLHAFDAAKIKTGKDAITKIFVRNAKEGESIKTLDDTERKLETKDLVIADSEQAIALAGIMGGKNTEISNETKTIIIESANFNASAIRMTSARLNLRTEASMRFEKSLDPVMAETAILKVLAMIKELNPSAKIVSKIIDEKNFSPNTEIIEITTEFINNKIGKEIDSKKITDILESLGFEVKKIKEKYEVKPPTWRATKDISIKEDLIEEIARIYGYNNIELQKPTVVLDTPDVNEKRILERKVKKFFWSAGATEVYNYSFVGEELLTKMGINISNYIKLKNYLSQEHTMLRKSLIPNLLKNIQTNQKLCEKINLFELGRVFSTQLGKFKTDLEGKNFLPKQDKFLSSIFLENGNSTPFYAAKALVQSLLEYLKVDYLIVKPKEVLSYMHDNRCAEIIVDDESLGIISELHPKTAQNFEILEKTAFFEINFTQLSEIYAEKIIYSKLNKFPKIELDLSVIVEEKTIWENILDIIKKEGKELIKEIKLFDIYKDAKIGKGKKSLAFRIAYQAEDRTLEMEEVQKIQDKIIFQLGKKVNAIVRK